MITGTTIIGFALLAMKQVQNKGEFDWKPTKNDVLALRAELKQYEPKIINGHKFYSFEQHLVKKGICTVLDDGQLAVTSPALYKREQQIHGLSQYIYEEDQKAAFKAFPEEKAMWREQIRDMFTNIRAVSKNA